MGATFGGFVLRVRHPDTRAFYERIGLLFAEERHGDGPLHYAHPAESGAVLELYPPPGNDTILVYVDDLASTVRDLTGEVLQEGVRWRKVIDPDGRTVLLMQRD